MILSWDSLTRKTVFGNGFECPDPGFDGRGIARPQHTAAGAHRSLTPPQARGDAWRWLGAGAPFLTTAHK